MPIGALRKISNGNAAGIVDSDEFREWVQKFLVLNIGKFVHCDGRSIIVMDNTSIHIWMKW